jgi:hypothetical protein
LIATLAKAGRSGEVRQQFETGQRALREVGGGSGPLLRAWRGAQAVATTSADRGTNRAEPEPDGRPTQRAAVLNALATPASLSVVVLPFVNLSSDAEQQHFVDGI